MFGAKSHTRLVRWLTSVPLLALLGLILGALISLAVIPKPNIATITVSGPVLQQAYTDDILDMLRHARDDGSVKAVVLEIDSPGGEASTIEQIYLDVLKLRKEKPVVASIGARGASGGYYMAIATNFIYAQPTSQLGSIGAWSSLPVPEELTEDILTSGPFKATGGSRRKATGLLEMVRQEFVAAVIAQRGERLKLSGGQLSRGEVYTGVEGLKYGLTDDIGTSTDAIEKAAEMAGVRNYSTIDINQELGVWQPFYQPSLSIENLKSRTGTMPNYYYLYFESE